MGRHGAALVASAKSADRSGRVLRSLTILGVDSRTDRPHHRGMPFDRERMRALILGGCTPGTALRLAAGLPLRLARPVTDVPPASHTTRATTMREQPDVDVEL